jgi:DNA-binding winged helix-turn-helix (wHTH) protein
MSTPRALAFGSFVVDLDAEELRRDGVPVALRPKTWAVLRHLVERPGRLVTKAELLDAVWPDVTVGDELPGVSVAELRVELGDDAREPRYIATLHRRGYRFVATITAATATHLTPSAPIPARPAVVGRNEALARLQAWLDAVMGGERRVGFVTGEPGIGKTTLVEALVAEASLPAGTRPARGDCLPQHGASEPFLPVIDALARLCAGPDGAGVVDALRRHAPLWLPHVIGDAALDDPDAAARQARAATPELMLRTLAGGIEALAADAPLVLVLEDLQWSDPSTVDLLGRLALRPETARLLVVGTYRPAEVLARRHPLAALRQLLRQRQRWLEVALDFLDEAAIGAFLAARFPGAEIPAGLPAWLAQRTDGNPLFLGHVADALEAEGIARHADGQWTVGADFARVGVPESLRELLEQSIETLPRAVRDALEAAAVVGPSFSAAALAAALEVDVADAERAAEVAVRRTDLVHREGDARWPDGTVAGRYVFVHALYREALLGGVPPAGRVASHRRIAERLERAWSWRAVEIAGELATHFEGAGDAARAAFHHQRAAEEALGRHAPREGLLHLDAALAQVERLPASPERTQQTMYLLVARGATQMVLDGHTAPSVGETFEQARALNRPGTETPLMLQVLGGLCTWQRLRGRVADAIATGEASVALAEQLGNVSFLVAGTQVPLAGALLLAGEVERAHRLGKEAIAVFDTCRRCRRSARRCRSTCAARSCRTSPSRSRSSGSRERPASAWPARSSVRARRATSCRCSARSSTPPSWRCCCATLPAREPPATRCWRSPPTPGSSCSRRRRGPFTATCWSPRAAPRPFPS